MSLEVNVPPVGESITEVTIASWKKQNGDTVKQDELLCELESDKASFDLTAPNVGVLTIVATEGQTLPIGALICKIEASPNGAAPQPVASAQAAATVAPVPQAAPSAQAAPAAQAAPVAQQVPSAQSAGQVREMRVPVVGESITEVVIANWLKEDGAQVAQDELICEIESDKASFELVAEIGGTLRIVAQKGKTLAIGDVICRIEGNGQQASASSPVAQPGQPAAPVAGEKSNSAAPAAQATPLAANMLAGKGLDPNQVKGTGPQGRITKSDVLSAQTTPAEPAPAQLQPAAPQSAVTVAKPAAPATPEAPRVLGSRNERRQAMSALRKTVARRLVAVKNETAMLTTFNEVDMKPIMDLRGLYKDKFKEKYQVGLGFMSFFTKAVCMALTEFPSVNARIEGEEMVFNDFVDISIAVSAPKGLVVPVIRNAEGLDFAGIEKEIVRLATLARDNKLTIEQMTGGTFTITNGGVFGSMLSTPIINAPQSAILGMHNIVERAMVVNGEVVVRPIMYVALSYDHRIIDGRESVGFLVRVKQLLEDPTRLLLGV